MIELFQMWALVEALGLICLPLTVTVFHNLPDRGWAFSKALGMALFAFCVWLPLMWLHFLPFSQLFIVGVALIVLAGNLFGFLRMRRGIAKVIRLNKAYIVATETIFLGMVFLLGWLRSYGPDIRSYEMFMDEGFIAAIMRSQHFPPNDMWFAGSSINYYYYAHFTIALLAKLLGQTPSIAFNCGICIFFGLTAVNLFGVTCNIVAWARYLRTRVKLERDEIERADSIHPPLLRGIPYGLLTILMGLILGNLAATQQWWKTHGDMVPYDWFAPSRVINNTINEFPAFSFLLSCFHAHVLALAFTILAIGMAFNLFLESEGKGLFLFGRGWQLPFTMIMTALVVGGLFTMNGWDFPTYIGLAILCIGMQQWLAYNARFDTVMLLDIFIAGAALLALSLILYLPFYINFISPSQGIGIVAAGDRSPLGAELLIYGLFAFVFLSLLLASIWKHPLFALSEVKSGLLNRRLFGIILLVALGGVLLLVVMQNGATFVIAASIAVLSVALIFYNIGDRSHSFTLLLGAIAFGLVAICEIFFLKDVFAGNYPRMNTIFKFYFQAWALLSIASGAGLFFILESFRPGETFSLAQRRIQLSGKVFWCAGLLLLTLAGMVYPLAAPYARYVQFSPTRQGYVLQRTNSLDGLSYLQSDPGSPGDYAAIRWLNANIQGDPVIVEAVGPDYSVYGRISVFTGLPTLMGWAGHEYQWRVNWFNNANNAIDFNQRQADVDTIYMNTNPALVLSTMAHYQAQYLYVGPLEYQNQKYSMVNLHRFSAFMQVVYNANGVTIYKVR